MLGETEIKRLAMRAVALAPADQVEVLIYGGTSALTRFAGNAVHQNVSERDHKLYFRVAVDGRVGQASTNGVDDEALRAAAVQAKVAASAAPETAAPDRLASAVELRSVNAFDENTANCPPDQRADQVARVCRAAADKGAEAYGAFETEARESAYANSQRAFAYHAGTRAEFQTVVRHNGSSGWARGASWQLGEVPVEQLGQHALQRAVDAAGAQAFDPQELPVVLDPYATADLLTMLAFPGMGARAVAEGQSWMNARIGQQAMSELVDIWDDGFDLEGLPATFDSEGSPKQRVDMVRAGVVKGPVYDRATASEAGTASTGHALPLHLPTIARRYSPAATNLFMAAGSVSTDDLIASTERGLYITRFWYTRHVHPRDCVVTGMTRDGVFLIEKGRLARPLTDLRFTQSYVEAMRRVEAVGSETCLITEDFLDTAVRAPAVKIASFRFTGSTV